MFEKKYKADNERIEPTRESLLSLSYKMKREQAKKKDKKKAVRWIRSAAAVAAAGAAATTTAWAFVTYGQAIVNYRACLKPDFQAGSFFPKNR